jgi:Tol biopolymer transport system component
MNKPMKTNPAIIYFLAIALYFLLPAFKPQAFKVPKGEYLGQEKPGLTAKIFAPGFVSLEDRVEFNCAWSPGGKEFYFSIDGPKGQWDLYISFRTPGGGWTESKKLGNEINTSDNEDMPQVSPDGKYFFFTRVGKNSDGKEQGDIYWIDAGILRK